MADSTIRVSIIGDARGFAQASQEVTGRLDRMGGRLKSFAGGLVAAFAIDRLRTFGQELFTLGSQVETWNAKAETVFGDQVGAMRDWADGVNESFGITNDELLGLSANMADLLKPMGFTSSEAASMSREMLDLSGALSAWSGGQRSAAEVSEILSSAMLGEREALKGLGISISQAEVDARALENAQAGLTFATEEQAQAYATQQLILEKSTDAQRAWEDGTMDNIKAQNELKAQFAEVKESLAVALMPAFNAAVQFMVNTVIPAFQSMAAWVEENWPLVRAAIVDNLQAAWDFVQPLIDTIRAAWELWGDNLLRHAELIWGYIKTSIENAITAVRAVLDIVMGLLSGDWSRVWGGIKDFVGAVWEQIKNVVSTAVAVLRNAVGAAIDGIKLYWSTVWNSIKDFTGTVWEGIKTGVSNGINAVVEFVTGLPGRIASAVSGAFSALWDEFRGVVNRIIDGWNSLSFTLPSVSVDWNGPFPGGDVTVGGWTIGTPNIPRLAQGGVITAPTLAMIGEDARTTPEIVTPERLMAEVFRSELRRSQPAVHIYLDGEEVTGTFLKRTELHRLATSGRAL